EGTSISRLKAPEDGVDCYDDHRVAMSFSILSVITPQPVVLLERECVGKTWPGWWDILNTTFKVRLEGKEIIKEEQQKKASKANDKSIFIIGMRGAGKTTLGEWAAKALGRSFVDLDTLLEAKSQRTIPEI